MRNYRDYYIENAEGYRRLSRQIEDTLSSVLLAYRLSGCQIDYFPPTKYKQFAYRVVNPPIAFFVWIMPVKHYVFFRRFLVDVEFNCNLIDGTELYTLKTLPEGFSKAFESTMELPLDFTK
jgi:hypothetical protein